MNRMIQRLRISVYNVEAKMLSLAHNYPGVRNVITAFSAKSEVSQANILRVELFLNKFNLLLSPPKTFFR